MTQMLVNTTLLEVQKVTVMENMVACLSLDAYHPKGNPIVNDFPDFLQRVTVEWARIP